VSIVITVGPWTVGAAVPEAERVPVTDPEELIAMGVELDAVNVDRWLHAPSTATVGEAPDAYGDMVDFRSISAMAFLDLKEPFVREWTSGHELFCPSGEYPFVIAQLHLPDGASLTGVRYWVYDNDTSDNAHIYLVESCLPDYGEGTPSSTIIINNVHMGSGSTPQNHSGWININPDLTIDNPSCDYLVKIRLGSVTVGGHYPCQGAGLRLQKIRAQFSRQVSPAPATATFNDVGTGHWAFRHIEALADSGITSGCGGGSFCPNANVTRAEMAIFLSKALGLFWNVNNH
jgi:hypothetical protein